MSTFQVGELSRQTFVCSDETIQQFATATGDFNPIHMDDEAAKSAGFRGRIAHGMWTAGLISSLLGTELPGPGSIYLSQDLSFRHPVSIGDSITITVEIVDIQGKKISLSTVGVNQDQTVVIDGKALVLLKSTD